MNTTNKLKFTTAGTFADGTQYRVVVQLADDCRNGHEDFSITGTTWEAGKPKTDRYFISGGAMGDTFARKLGGVYGLFNKLHLCDFNGVPMHCTANMRFRLQEGKFQRPKSDFKTEFCEYYRITPDEFDALNAAKIDEDYFILTFLDLPEILKRWKEEADAGIKWLEEKTGLKFESKATRSNLILPEPEKIEELRKLKESGYFDAEAVAQRVAEKEENRRAKLKEQIRLNAAKKQHEVLLDLEIDLLMVDLFGEPHGCIYYKHENKIAFNRNKSSFNRLYTQDEVDLFVSRLDKLKFPEGLRVECL